MQHVDIRYFPDPAHSSTGRFSSLRISLQIRQAPRPWTVLVRPLERVAEMNDDIARAAKAKKGSPFLSTEQAAFYLGLSPRRLQQMRASACGPEFRRHSRFVRYHIDDLDAWSEMSGSRSQHG